MKEIDYYTPKDNSKAICLETGKQAYPAGLPYKNTNPIKLKINRQPFYKCVIFHEEKHIVKMIEGVDESTGLHYRTLYY